MMGGGGNFRQKTEHLNRMKGGREWRKICGRNIPGRAQNKREGAEVGCAGHAGSTARRPGGCSEGDREDEEMRLGVQSPMTHAVSHGRNFRFYRNPLESLNSELSNSTSNLNGGNKLHM